MSPCLIVDEIAATIGFESIIRLSLMLNIAVLGLFSYSRSKLSYIQKIIITIYGVLIIYFIITGLTIYLGSGFTTKTPIKNYGISILIILIMASPNFNLSRLLTLFINIAFILALLSIIQYFLFYFDLHEPNSYILKTYSPGDHRFIGFGGFIDPDYLQGNTYRVESFWREPSRYAQYLQVPLFISAYRFIVRRNIKNTLYLTVITMAMILTFSAANYFSIIIAAILYLIYGNKDALTSYKSVKYALSIMFIPLLMITLYEFYNYTNQVDSGMQDNVLQKKTYLQIIKRLERMDIATSVLDISLFGEPRIRNRWKSNPSAIGMMIIWGGLPGLFLSLSFSYLFFKTILNRIRISIYGIVYLGSISFFIAFNWYGSFFGHYYLFLIAIYLQLVNNESENKDLMIVHSST